MRNNVKRIISIVLLSTIICALCLYYTHISRTDKNSFFYDFYYYTKPNTIDVLAVGSSHIYYSINPVQMYGEKGLAAYVLANGSQSTWFTYYYLKEALKSQKPQVVILDTYTVIAEDSVFDTAITMNFYQMNFSWNKYESLKNSGENNWAPLLFRFPITHGEYANIGEQDIRPADSCYLGYHFDVGVLPFENVAKVEEMGDRAISEKAEKYLRMSIELCQDNDMEVILFNAPWPSITEENMMYYNYVGKIAEEYHVPYLDLCKNVEEIGIKWDCDAFDESGHLNYFGAYKTTKYVEDYLVSNYELDNHKAEVGYEHWNEATGRLEEVLKDYGITGYEEIPKGFTNEDSCENYCVDEVTEIVQENSKETISGWIYVGDIKGKKIFFKIEDSLYELDWIDRPDVNEAFNDDGYFGYTGYYRLIDKPPASYASSLVVIDYNEMKYTEYDTGIIYLENNP